MKTIITNEDNELFKVEVVVTDNDKLAVRMTTKEDGEFVGQLFSSLKTVGDIFKRFTDTELSKDDMTKIEKAIEGPTPKHENKLTKLKQKVESTNLKYRKEVSKLNTSDEFVWSGPVATDEGLSGALMEVVKIDSKSTIFAIPLESEYDKFKVLKNNAKVSGHSREDDYYNVPYVEIKDLKKK